MVTSAASQTLAGQARQLYTEELVKGLAVLVQDVCEAAKALLDRPADHAAMVQRSELAQRMPKLAPVWQGGMTQGLRHLALHGLPASRAGGPASTQGQATVQTMALVDDNTIELEIMTSRLALAMLDRASWEFSDLRSRIVHLEQQGELQARDPLRAQVLARVVVDAWCGAGFTRADWRELQPSLHAGLALLIESCYHETNRWLIERQVLPEVNLRHLIRRERTRETGAGRASVSGHSVRPGFSPSAAGPHSGRGPETGSHTGGYTGSDRSSAGRHSGAGRDVAPVTDRAGVSSHGSAAADALLGRLNRLVGREVPNLLAPTRPRELSAALSQAIDQAQVGIRQRLTRHGAFEASGQASGQAGAQAGSRAGSRAGDPAGEETLGAAVLDDLQQRRQKLKRAAATPEERATIEIVALLFQSILTDDRIPAVIRVWFARLQMPVLRVAVSEPDFFATVDHPARRLIDRMGACVLGFDSGSGGNVGDALTREIKRIVQVVEAYPDTGRRVFQTVLTEFEKFLEHWFKNENEASRKGVSLAQQVEQRETMAIQYTIELRRMLNEMPVQDGVRHFLFQVWADVLATCGVRHGVHDPQTKAMKRAAADLIWSASAKVTREDRSEVIRRLPTLLKALRQGMGIAGIDATRQDEHIQQLNDALAAAFTAKAAVISQERLQELMERLETLEQLLPDAADAGGETDMALDESMVFDLSGHESTGLEIVTEGGSPPTQAMLAWARELQVGSWYMLDHRGHNEPVQLAWQGARKQLSLFVTVKGRCVLFQQQRLASFLQAGLLVPAQDEALTVRATRSALAKLDAEPSVLGAAD